MIPRNKLAVANDKHSLSIEVETSEEIDDRDWALDVEIPPWVMETNFHPTMIAGREPKHLGATGERFWFAAAPPLGLLRLPALSSRRSGWFVRENNRLPHEEPSFVDGLRVWTKCPLEGSHRPSGDTKKEPHTASAEESLGESSSAQVGENAHTRRISTNVRRLRPRRLPSAKTRTTTVTATAAMAMVA